MFVHLYYCVLLWLLNQSFLYCLFIMLITVSYLLIVYMQILPSAS